MAKKSKLLTEFKEFVMRGNVLDMAVGVIIATAFGAITTTRVQKVFMPLKFSSDTSHTYVILELAPLFIFILWLYFSACGIL